MNLSTFTAGLLIAVASVTAQAATIQVTLKDNAIQTDQPGAAAGPVTFVVANAGVMPHEFVVLKTDAPADQLPMNASGSKALEKNINMGEIENIAAGQSSSKDYKLAAGNYVLVCNMPGHYKMGMHTAFTVK